MFEIGSSLREARTRKGIDFLMAETATKVRAKYLRALEEEDFSTLPGQTYVRGFLRAYADYLGLDGQLYVDEFNSRFFVEVAAAAQEPRRVPARQKQHRRVERNVVFFTVVAIGVAAALIIAAWKFGGGSKHQSIPNLAQGPAKPSLPARGANLFVQAVRGNSLLEVHAGTASGRLLYHGTLERGQSQRFSARRLWINVGSPENLWLRLNGSPVPVGGSCPRVLVITAKQLTSTARCG